MKDQHLSYALQSKGALSTYMLSANRLPMDTILGALLRSGDFQKALQQIQACHDESVLHFKGEKDGMTALHHLAAVSSFHGAPGFVKALTDALIERDVDVHATTKSGMTAVHMAALNGHCEMVNILFNRGASVDVEDNNGGTPITRFVAAGFSPETMVSVLLDASKDPAALTNSAVRGTRSKRLEKEVCSFVDPSSRFFDTDPADCRAKEVVLEQLAKRQEHENNRRWRWKKIVT